MEVLRLFSWPELAQAAQPEAFEAAQLDMAMRQSSSPDGWMP